MSKEDLKVKMLRHKRQKTCRRLNVILREKIS